MLIYSWRFASHFDVIFLGSLGVTFEKDITMDSDTSRTNKYLRCISETDSYSINHNFIPLNFVWFLQFVCTRIITIVYNSRFYIKMFLHKTWITTNVTTKYTRNVILRYSMTLQALFEICTSKQLCNSDAFLYTLLGNIFFKKSAV